MKRLVNYDGCGAWLMLLSAAVALYIAYLCWNVILQSFQQLSDLLK